MREMSRMKMSIGGAEREGIRVVTQGEKWCRPQPVSKNTVRVAAESGPSVFEKGFWLCVAGVVFLWVCLRVFDFTLIPPAYHGLLLTQPFCGLHSWDLADRAWAARSHLKYGLGYTKGLRTLVVGDPPPPARAPLFAVAIRRTIRIPVFWASRFMAVSGDRARQPSRMQHESHCRRPFSWVSAEERPLHR